MYRLKPKKILDVQEVSADTAQQIGCPGGKDFEHLFGSDCTSLFAVYFEPVQPEDCPEDRWQNLSILFPGFTDSSIRFLPPSNQMCPKISVSFSFLLFE